ncbi:MAG: diguanylate cyclase [Magnetococcales bacterium]|nr:diguanylate cyclase [Magnetococcales bacterium]
MTMRDHTPRYNMLLGALSVLYVEDNSEIRDEMSELLSRHVKRVFPCPDAASGFATYQQESPDLLITDIRMPHMDGLDMVQRIRQTDPDIPVIVTTAYGSDDYFVRAIELGVDRYLFKPVLPAHLIEAVTRCAKNQWNQRQRDAAEGYQRFVLDIHPNLLMVLNKGRIEFLNRTFLNFARLDSVSEFLDRHPGLESFLDPREEAATTGWVDHLRKVATSDTPILFMHHPDNPEATRQPFVLSCNQLPEEGRMIFTFADVTGIENQLRDLKVKAFRDPLTGICNRETLADTLRAECKRAERHRIPLSVIMMDLDHFKQINDNFGHMTGDAILQRVAMLVKENLRGSDTLARWGGEEFMVVTPDAPCAAARKLAEKIRAIVETYTFPQVGRVTASFGVATFQPGDDPASLTGRADQALYAAKRAGRNCVRGCHDHQN